DTLRERLETRGSIFQSTSDSEVIIHLIAASPATTLVGRIVDALAQVRGAYSLVFLTETQVIAARDPGGFRPLVLRRGGDAVVVTSERGARVLVDARWEREGQRGEIVVIDERGVNSLTPSAPAPSPPGVFE